MCVCVRLNSISLSPFSSSKRAFESNGSFLARVKRRTPRQTA